MAAFLFTFSPGLSTWYSWSLLDRIPTLLGLVLLSIFLYGACLLITGFRPGQLKQPKNLQAAE